MNNKLLITFNSIISLFPSSSGGRKSPIKFGYRANAVFGIELSNLESYWKDTSYYFGDDDTDLIKNCDIELQFDACDFYPGQARIVQVLMIRKRAEYIGKELLQSNIEFYIREGARIIGTGRIISKTVTQIT